MTLPIIHLIKSVWSISVTKVVNQHMNQNILGIFRPGMKCRLPGCRVLYAVRLFTCRNTTDYFFLNGIFDIDLLSTPLGLVERDSLHWRSSSSRFATVSLHSTLELYQLITNPLFGSVKSENIRGYPWLPWVPVTASSFLKMIPHMLNPMNDGDDSAVITLTRKKSSAADIVRRNSDTRILGQSDLNLAQRIENIRKKSDTKIIR